MIELPKIYLVAFWVAFLLHIFFMQKYETYAISYWHKNCSGSGPGHCHAKIYNGPPTFDNLTTFLKSDFDEETEIVLNGWQKTGYGWEWNPIWKQLKQPSKKGQ